MHLCTGKSEKNGQARKILNIVTSHAFVIHQDPDEAKKRSEN